MPKPSIKNGEHANVTQCLRRLMTQVMAIQKKHTRTPKTTFSIWAYKNPQRAYYYLVQVILNAINNFIKIPRRVSFEL
jgi:hypothetical protein